MVKILALQGSPRPNGNTHAVLEIVLAAARKAGARTETVQLSHLKNISGCLECFACQKEKDKPGCVVKDAMQSVIDKAMKADVVVWATPVFCWSPAWPLKIAMDRFFCTFKFSKDGKLKSLLQGHKMAAVITAGGDENDGADLITETCRRIARFSRARWLGALVAANAGTPNSLSADKKLTTRARAFGSRLAKSAN
ncbi:MAG TPA: flavodoxin family protein [Phycisphaerae bacterium]|nr:flavodoxin family protein [Phycisphaerae bacterium]